MSREETVTKKKYTSYTSNFKLQVVNYAVKNGKRAAGRKFEVDEKCVRRWCQQEQLLKTAPKEKCAFRGKCCKYPELEENLYDVVLSIRQSGNAISREMIQVEANKLARKHNIPLDQFKASYGWVRRFLKRKNLTVGKTMVYQKFPSDYEENLVNFQRLVFSLRRWHHYSLSQVGNCSQTPLFFHTPDDTVGEQSIQICSTRVEKQRCTVMLAITAEGHKLPPYVVFETVPNEKFPAGLVIRVSEKDWMTEDLILDWISSVWNHRPCVQTANRSLLVLDSFQGHLSDKIKMHLLNSKCDVAVVPDGLLELLQPLDVFIHQQFKAAFVKNYSNWIAMDHVTSSKESKCISLPEVCEWILQAWASISTEIVTKSFKVTGISNNMDGSENHYLWNPQDVSENSSADDTDSD